MFYNIIISHDKTHNVHAVPSSPPQQVIVTSVDSTTMKVSWKPPPMIHHNGLLTGYIIQYTSVGSSDTTSVTVTSGNTFIISGLDKSNYSVSVAATNINGTGPFSTPTVLAPGEDDTSMCFIMSLQVHV